MPMLLLNVNHDTGAKLFLKRLQIQKTLQQNKTFKECGGIDY